MQKVPPPPPHGVFPVPRCLENNYLTGTARRHLRRLHRRPALHGPTGGIRTDDLPARERGRRREVARGEAGGVLPKVGEGDRGQHGVRDRNREREGGGGTETGTASEPEGGGEREGEGGRREEGRAISGGTEFSGDGGTV